MKLLDGNMEGMANLLGDVIQLVDVLYVVCKDECDQRGMTDEDFGRGMAGDVIEQVGVALFDELLDFFPNPRVRENLKRVTQISKSVGGKVQNRQIKKVEAILDGLDEEQLAERVEKDLLSRLGSSSGGAPASAG